MKHKIVKVETAEVLVRAGSTNTQFNFPDLQNIRDKKLLGIECYDAIAVPRSPNGLPVSNAQLFSKAFLVLYSDNSEHINRIPLVTLKRVKSNNIADNAAGNAALVDRSVEDVLPFSGQRIIWPKSYVRLSDSGSNPLSAEDDVVFLFTIYYEDKA